MGPTWDLSNSKNYKKAAQKHQAPTMPRRVRRRANTNTSALEPIELKSVKKTSLASIIKESQSIARIEEIVQKMHKVTVKTYQFLKLYYLNALETNAQLPNLDKAFIIQVMRVVAKYEVNSNNNLETRQRLMAFHDDHMPYFQETIDLTGLGIYFLT
jgi:hypothetical protein